MRAQRWTETYPPAAELAAKGCSKRHSLSLVFLSAIIACGLTWDRISIFTGLLVEFLQIGSDGTRAVWPVNCRAFAIFWTSVTIAGLDLGFLALGFQRFALDFGELLLS